VIRRIRTTRNRIDRGSALRKANRRKPSARCSLSWTAQLRHDELERQPAHALRAAGTLPNGHHSAVFGLTGERDRVGGVGPGTQPRVTAVMRARFGDGGRTGSRSGAGRSAGVARPAHFNHRPGAVVQVPDTLLNRLFECSNTSRSCPPPGSQVGEPFGEEPPGVWGSLDGHLPWETALREPSRLVQTGSRPTSHRGGHWFDPSIAHQVRGYVDLHQAHDRSHSCSGKVRRKVVTLVDTPVGQKGRPSKSLTFGQSVALIRAARLYGLYA
jgi:hypothetical protein